MRMRFALGILGTCFMNVGCGPFAYATRVLVVEPIHYCRTADDILERHRNYKLAEDTWQALAHADPGQPYSPDYVTGFKDGFADYLQAGGSGEPPPLPPRHYWKMAYETPQGHQAIEDWFAGFRLGAALARESGYREWVTIPSSSPRANAADLHLSSIPTKSSALPSDENVLPPPRKIAPPRENGK
jgi:hypothetical protein